MEQSSLVKFTYIDERSPWSNGLVERFNRVFNDHWKKACVDGSVLEPTRWSSWLPRLTTVYNASYHQEIANTPYFLMYKEDFKLNFLPSSGTSALPNSVLRKRKYGQSNELTLEECMAIQESEYQAILQIIRDAQAKLANTYEFSQILSANYINLSEGQLALVHLGDSNGGMGDKFRCHAGPFRVVRRIANAQYLIAGADKIEVTVHAAKLLRYNFSYADLLGYGRLAPSAVGAAQSRLFRFQKSLDVDK